MAYIQAGQLEKAISHWKRIISLFPGIAEVHFNLGTAYRRMGYFHEAISAFKEAVKIRPNYAKAHNNLAILYSSTAHHDIALRHLRIAESLGYPVHPNLKGFFRKMFKRSSGS
jgi:protein O-GlcNAc transferase